MPEITVSRVFFAAPAPSKNGSIAGSRGCGRALRGTLTLPDLNGREEPVL